MHVVWGPAHARRWMQAVVRELDCLQARSARNHWIRSKSVHCAARMEANCVDGRVRGCLARRNYLRLGELDGQQMHHTHRSLSGRKDTLVSRAPRPPIRNLPCLAAVTFSFDTPVYPERILRHVFYFPSPPLSFAGKSSAAGARMDLWPIHLLLSPVAAADPPPSPPLPVFCAPCHPFASLPSFDTSWSSYPPVSSRALLTRPVLISPFH